MRVTEIVKLLSHFPATYDVCIPTVPEGDWTPFFTISDDGKGQVWMYPMHYAGDNPDYSKVKLNEKGEFIKGESAND